MVVQHSSKDYFHQVRAETSLRYIYSDDINFKAGNDLKDGSQRGIQNPIKYLKMKLFAKNNWTIFAKNSTGFWKWGLYPEQISYQLTGVGALNMLPKIKSKFFEINLFVPEKKFP